MKGLLIGILAIAITGCGGSKAYDEAVAEVQELQSRLSVSMTKEEYRQSVSDLKVAIDRVPESQREPLSEIYNFYDAALNIWGCSADCPQKMVETAATIDEVSLTATTNPDDAIHALWYIADMRGDKL